MVSSAVSMSARGSMTTSSRVMTEPTVVPSGSRPAATTRDMMSRSEKMPLRAPASTTAHAPMLRSAIRFAAARTLSCDSRIVSVCPSMSSAICFISSPSCHVSQAVVGRVLIRLAERREVEYAVDECIQRSAELHDHHPDVQKLRGILSDDVDAEQLESLALEDDLDEALGVADDLSAGVVAVERAAQLVVDALFLALLFRQPDRGDFRDGVRSEE